MSDTHPLATLWSHVAENLKCRISPDAFDRWFSSLALLEANDQKVRLEVPDSIHQLWIEMNYLVPLKAAFLAITGILPTLELSSGNHEPAPLNHQIVRSGRKSPNRMAKSAGSGTSRPSAEAPTMDHYRELSVADPGPATSGRQPDDPANWTGDPVSSLESDLPGAAHDVAAPAEADLLSPRPTFKTYVVGANNEFAHAAAMAVAQRPARAYNPLFFYGGTGLGKTHLMQAIGDHIRATRPKARVLYITSEEFTNQFIAALQEHSLPRFRKRFRQADVLLIDDVQFLAGKERSQEEFFHTFNALFDGNKQVVLSSDCPPSEMRNLEARLASRFEWGMMAEITPPDEETRVAILRCRAASLHVEVPPDVINYLASRIRSNVRRLHGALFRVGSWVSLHGPISLPQTEDLLRDILQEEGRQSITIDKIQKTIAESYDIRLADMTSRKRPANIAFARQVAMYLARELTGASYQEIGDAFGGRDHGTIMHGCRSIDAKIKQDESIRLKIEGLATAMQRSAK